MKKIEKSTGKESVNDTIPVDTSVDTSMAVETTTKRQQIGARMKAARNSLGLSQVDFCVQSGYNIRTYQRNEEGRNEAGITLGAAFSRAGINANWLLTGAGPMLLSDLQAADRSSALDRARMRLALEAVEEGIEEAKGAMAPAKKANLLLAVYDLMQEPSVTKAKVLQLVKFAA